VTCQAANIHGLKEAFGILSMWSMIACLLFLAAGLAVQGEIESGSIITLFIMINAWAGSFSGILTAWTELHPANVSWAKLKDIFDCPVLIALREGRPITRTVGRLEFRNATFRHPSCTENAIDDMSLTVEAGQTVVIVGESGCGK
jgi:ABC-type bacteriocin/lantibiotic exporter with double-glycine peptidase domain